MIKIIPPLPSSEVRAAIVEGIIEATAREIVVVTKSTAIACIVCEGNDPFCGTCSGTGITRVNRSIPLLGTVKWIGSNNKKYRPEGQYVEGDVTVTVSYADTVSVDVYSSLIDMLNYTDHVIVDGKRCVLDKFHVGGNPPNRMYLVLKEDATISGHRIG